MQRAGLCLVLGLVTTVAVAWGAAVFSPRPAGGTREVVRRTSGEQAVLEWRGPGGARRYWDEYPPDMHVVRALVTEVPIVAPGTPPLRRDWGQLSVTPTLRQRLEGPPAGFEDARGWPALALWCSFSAREWPGGALPASGCIGGILVSAAGTSALDAQVLPYRPLWPGLLMNSAVYALAWAGLLLLAPGWARRAHRQRAGRCAGCAYDLRGLGAGAACPECGRGRRNPGAAA